MNPLPEEIKIRYESFLKEFLTNINLDFEIFQNALKESQALIAGGSVCRSVYDKNWEVEDLDIYVNIKNCINIRDVINSKCNKVVLQGIDSFYCNSFLHKNRISKVLRFKFGTKHIDLMYVYNDTPLNTVVNNFDLSCCQSWYSGDNIYTSNPELISVNESNFNSEYIKSLVSGNSFTRSRIEKYRNRGFKIMINDRSQIYHNNELNIRDKISITQNENFTHKYFKRVIFNFIFNTKAFPNIFNLYLNGHFDNTSINAIKIEFRGDGYDFEEFNNYEDYNKIEKGDKYNYAVNRIYYILKNFDKFFTWTDESICPGDSLYETTDSEYNDTDSYESSNSNSEETNQSSQSETIEANNTRNLEWEGENPMIREYLPLSTIIIDTLLETFKKFYEKDIKDNQPIDNLYPEFTEKCYDEINLIEYEAGEFLSKNPQNVIIKTGDMLKAYNRNNIIQFFNNNINRFKINGVEFTKTYLKQIIFYSDVEKIRIPGIKMFILKDNGIKISNNIIHIVEPISVEKYLK
jgi:hypothetical protein